MPRIASQKKLKAQIEKLQAQLDRTAAARKKVVRSIIKQMNTHEITIAELRDAAGGRPQKRKTRKSQKRKTRKSVTTRKTKKRVSRLKGRKAAIKYRDKRGNTWTGRGRPPRWLVAAEKAGAKRTSFAV